MVNMTLITYVVIPQLTCNVVLIQYKQRRVEWSFRKMEPPTSHPLNVQVDPMPDEREAPPTHHIVDHAQPLNVIML